MEPRIQIGTMNFGGRTPEPEAKRIVARALERGATFFDTANVYGDGASERILGGALEGRRESVKIATKVGLLRQGGKPEGLGRERIRAALEESLARLRTDYVDVYYLHAPDPKTPIGETLEGLAPLLASGRVRAWGVSNFASWQILEVMQLSDVMGLPRPVLSQVLYNLLVRQLDLEYFAFAQRYPIQTTVYNPLAGGLLARRPQPGAEAPPGSRFHTNKLYRRRYWSNALMELTERFDALAKEADMELVAFSYAWLAGRKGVDRILAGPGTLAHLDAAFDGAALTLPEAVRMRVDEIHREFVGTDVSYAR